MTEEEYAIDMSLLLQAREFASNKHKDQMYGKHPYIHHLKQVQNLYYQIFGHDTTAAICCWLHDILEDTDASPEDIAMFGNEVCETVNLLTRTGEAQWVYIARIKSNRLASKVKVADTLANLQESIRNNEVNRIKKYLRQLQELYS